jgi:hypothetical protein
MSRTRPGMESVVPIGSTLSMISNRESDPALPGLCFRKRNRARMLSSPSTIRGNQNILSGHQLRRVTRTIGNANIPIAKKRVK